MPNVTGIEPTANPINRGWYYCQIKKNWSDNWLFKPWVFPIQCTELVAPEVGEAEIRYDFGSIKRETSASFASFTPTLLRDWYLRIQVQYPGLQPTTVWHGVLTDEQIAPERPAVLSGEQSVKAFGLMHLLDRQVVSTARVVNEQGSIKKIDWIPNFNAPNRSGLRIDGNRTETKTGSSHHFSRDGFVWTNLDIVRYLLRYHAPSVFTVKLSGQYDVLDDIEDVHDLGDRTLWDCLNHLIDRKRGIGFYPYVNDSGVIYLHVFTVTDKTLTAGGKKLPANPNKLFLNMPTAFPYTHEMGSPPFRTTSTNRYDTCTVRSERVKVTATYSNQDETLDRSWWDALQFKYEEGAGSDEDDEANDKARSSEELRDVWRAFRVSPDWDGEVGDGEGGQKANVWLTAQPGGKLSSKTKGVFWRSKKEFLRELPFKRHWDYSQYPPVDNSSSDAEIQFAEMLVAIKDVYEGDDHEADEKWHIIDKLHDDNEDLHSANVMPLQNDMGFRISCSPGHYFAYGDFNGDEYPTKKEPEMSWKKMLVTATFESDIRAYVTAFKTTPPAHETDRTLTIDVPGAEYWLVAPNSVIDVRKGELVRIAPGGNNVRNDKEKLLAVAAFARAWYEPFRQSVQITIKRMGLFGMLGGLLQGINDFNFSVPVRTVMTGRTINFQEQTTTLETGWMAFDVGSVVKDMDRKRRHRKGRL